MKKIALALLIACIGTSAYSEESTVSKLEFSQGFCETVESLAYIAQSDRQAGKKASKTIRELLELTNSIDIKEVKELQQETILKIVQNAYKEPVYSSQKLKDEVISKFEEVNYLSCMESLNK